MLKKYSIYIIISLIIIMIIWMIKLNTKNSITKDYQFEIDDISLITKVFLADRSGNTITLTK